MQAILRECYQSLSHISVLADHLIEALPFFYYIIILYLRVVGFGRTAFFVAVAAAVLERQVRAQLRDETVVLVLWVVVTCNYISPLAAGSRARCPQG